MNFGVIALLAISGWALLSIVVSLAIGGATKARDGGEPAHSAGR
jgi:hypothetical protein